MYDRGDRIVVQQTANEELVADLALVEMRAIGHQAPHSRREIVQHNHIEAALKRSEDHVAADIAGTAGDQNGHDVSFKHRLSG